MLLEGFHCFLSRAREPDHVFITNSKELQHTLFIPSFSNDLLNI